MPNLDFIKENIHRLANYELDALQVRFLGDAFHAKYGIRTDSSYKHKWKIYSIDRLEFNSDTSIEEAYKQLCEYLSRNGITIEDFKEWVGFGRIQCIQCFRVENEVVFGRFSSNYSLYDLDHLKEVIHSIINKEKIRSVSNESHGKFTVENASVKLYKNGNFAVKGMTEDQIKFFQKHIDLTEKIRKL